MLLDEDPSHTAKASQMLAEELGIRLLWLPKRCPELNPMDRLWGIGKDKVCANRQYADIDEEVDRFVAYLMNLRPSETLRAAGVLSQRFWLKFWLSK
jgi:DDE superfamily endonuclease